MALQHTLNQIARNNDLLRTDVMKTVSNEIEAALTIFLNEIRQAPDMETLLCIRRILWDPSFAEGGTYHKYCCAVSKLKIWRLNADTRYCTLLHRKIQKEREVPTISFKVVPRITRATTRTLCDTIIEDNGELSENVITYSSI